MKTNKPIGIVKKVNHPMATVLFTIPVISEPKIKQDLYASELGRQPLIKESGYPIKYIIAKVDNIINIPIFLIMFEILFISFYLKA